MHLLLGFVGCRTAQKAFSERRDMARSAKALGCVLALAVLACSCIIRKDVVLPARQEAAVEPAEIDTAPAKEWIVSRLSGRLGQILEERVVHITANAAPRLYQETWGKNTPHVDIFFSDYALRLPLGEIAGYPWESVEEQFQTGQLGPVLLKNGWQVWLGYIERADAFSHDLSISARETCSQLSSSGDAERDPIVRRLCDDFREGFVFADDLELFRRLWHSPFHVEKPMELGVKEALATLFLADLKRLISPPGAEEHVAEVATPRMKGFEFGGEITEPGFSTELFDDSNHVTVLFLPPEPPGEPLDEEFRRKVLASVRRHKRWAPGFDMLGKAEAVQQFPDLDNSREVSTLLLFSSLQFPDHKSRAARMLTKLFPPGDPQYEWVTSILEAMIRGE